MSITRKQPDRFYEKLPLRASLGAKPGISYRFSFISLVFPLAWDSLVVLSKAEKSLRR
ncbi:hypothetical protein [Persicitalea sp.]|uniref:hypothetical protein n=1 Tax=Persicitalea sp. TaxID=3100273 RepID=UPI00359310DE